MPHDTNDLGQPVGYAVAGWKPPAPPARAAMEGRYCRLAPLAANEHAEPLHAANVLNADGSLWTYMAYGPFDSLADYRRWMEGACRGNDPIDRKSVV
jgi:hypothetical protein